MSSIFIDTGAWYALEVEDDKNHKEAISFRDELRKCTHGSLATSDYILDEAITLLRMRKGIGPAVSFAEKVYQNKSLHLVWIDHTIFHEAERIMKENGTKKSSFTDCTSFAIMRQLKVDKAFSFDGNFAEAGFVKLP